jgi:hypothetical protein
MSQEAPWLKSKVLAKKNEIWVEPSTTDEKRARYLCGNKFTTIDNILPYDEYAKVHKLKTSDSKLTYNPILNSKISLWTGDITALEIDAIVNAATSKSNHTFV